MRRGQIDISFGMIFSIFIIIAVLATSFYVIQYFTNLSKCTTIGLFYEDLQEKVDSAWRGTTSKTLLEANIPGSIDYVCFGNMSQSPNQADLEKYNELRKYYRLTSKNVFMYPVQKSCSQLTNYEAKHINVNEFFCIKQSKGEVKLVLEKGAFENTVSINTI